eukprot:5343786-Alexandrium_andersonii.AAC.1
MCKTFSKRRMPWRWKRTAFKALVQGAIMSAAETRVFSQTDLAMLERKQAQLARRLLGGRAFKAKHESVHNDEVRRRAAVYTVESVLQQRRLLML